MNPGHLQSLKQVQRHARDWLLDSAAPLWSTAGVLDDGMFAERLGLDGTPVRDLNRRMRVQARQIYSFCVIGQLGWTGPWQRIVSQPLDTLIAHGRRADGLFVHLFDPEGAVLDASADLYDQAFGLLALAHAARALGRHDLLEVADTIFETLETWRRPQGGFWEGGLTACPPYRQNPHMHMFEAALVNRQLSGTTKWDGVIAGLDALVHERFQDAETGAVTEYFDERWNPLPGEDGAIVEPGHCFEWAWLFETASPVRTDTSDRLTAFARRYGIDREKGVAINEVRLNGQVRDGAARLWPQTERLKAAVARHRRLKSEEEHDEIIAAYKGLCRYMDMRLRGLWRDRLQDDGQWVDEAAPASSFYHIVCSLNELLRLEV